MRFALFTSAGTCILPRSMLGEEEIDLTASHDSLVEIEEKVRSAVNRHNKMLKQLGLLPLPFAK